MMFYNNPFAELATVIPAYVMQYFVAAMVLLIVVGVGLDMLHKKNVVYFFRNAQKAKKSAKEELNLGKKTAVILQTVVHDIATTSELMNKNILILKAILVFLLATVAILSLPILLNKDNTHFKHALEWNYFVGVILFYLFTRFLWRRTT